MCDLHVNLGQNNWFISLCQSQKALHYDSVEIMKGKTSRKEKKLEVEGMPSQGSHITCISFSLRQLVFMNVHYIDVRIINNVLSHCMFNNLSSQQLTFLDIIETDFLRPPSSHKSLLSSSFIFLTALPPGIHITICFTPCCASVVCHATMKGAC